MAKTLPAFGQIGGQGNPICHSRMKEQFEPIALGNSSSGLSGPWVWEHQRPSWRSIQRRNETIKPKPSSFN
jgi:hypothetical protein